MDVQSPRPDISSSFGLRESAYILFIIHFSLLAKKSRVLAVEASACFQIDVSEKVHMRGDSTSFSSVISCPSAADSPKTLPFREIIYKSLKLQMSQDQIANGQVLFERRQVFPAPKETGYDNHEKQISRRLEQRLAYDGPSSVPPDSGARSPFSTCLPLLMV